MPTGNFLVFAVFQLFHFLHAFLLDTPNAKFLVFAERPAKIERMGNPL